MNTSLAAANPSVYEFKEYTGRNAFAQGPRSKPVAAGAADMRAAAGLRLIPALTRRQTEIIERLARGMNDKQIAYDLGISGATVKCHARGAVSRLNARNRLHAVALYVSYGFDPT